MEHRTRVKFCGITRLDDAIEAVKLGVDALGFVFHDKSPRNIAAAEAQAIIRQLPPFVSIVGLFVDPDRDTLAAILADVPLDLVQFHGAETASECADLARPYIKAVRMADGVDLTREIDRYVGAQALLIDAFDEELVGGTGAVFDWSRVPSTLSKPIILAGGLDASNVARAIATVRPFAVDVSSGIEKEKGIKDVIKMQQFMQEVRNIER